MRLCLKTCIFMGDDSGFPQVAQGCVQSPVPALAFKPCSSNGPSSSFGSQINVFSRSNSLSVFSGSGTLLRRLCSLCFDRRFHLSQSVNHSAQFPYCCASLSVFSTISLTSASKELSMSGDASFQLGSVYCLAFSHLDGIRYVSKAPFQL